MHGRCHLTASSSSSVRIASRSSKLAAGSAAPAPELVIDQPSEHRVNVAPVVAVSVLEQRQQLQQRAQSVVVLHAVVLGNLLEELQVVLVQDPAVFVADLGCS